MKKIVLFVVFAALLTVSSVLAQSGVLIIDPTRNNTGVASFDDIKVGSEYQIDDFGIIKIRNYEENDKFWNSEGYRKEYYDDTKGADTTRLIIDIINTTFIPKNFIESVSVKIVYDDQYEIKGWWFQVNDNDNYVSLKNSYEIKPFYQGHYHFGVTVPDYLMKDSKPLRMEVTLGDIELTYHIRK